MMQYCHAHNRFTRVLPLCCGVLALFAALLLFPLAADASSRRLILYAPEPGIEQDMLVVNLGVNVDSQEDLANMLRDGAVLSLDISLTLERERSWWANAQDFSREYSSILRHDPLSRDFLVTVPGIAQRETLRGKHLDRLLRESWQHLKLPLGLLSGLTDVQEDDSFLVRARVSLKHTEVPPWLRNNMLFWSSEVAPPEERASALSLPRQQ